MRICVLFMFFLLSGVFAVAQKTKDTVFLLRENKEYYHAVYIERNPRSAGYTRLKAHTGSPFDTAFYHENIHLLKEAGTVILHHTLTGMPKRWCPLYRYKGRFYGYVPSDGFYDDWVEINDSIFLSYSGGDMRVNAITGFHKSGDSAYAIDTKVAGNKTERINIYVIDAKSQLAIFEYPDRTDNKFEWRAPAAQLWRFPLVVNYCASQKQQEFKFDPPGFEQWLRRWKQGKANE